MPNLRLQTYKHEAPPFVRILPDWTLKAERAWYEYQVLVEENKWAPGVVPEVYGYDKETETIVMEYLTPHIILRKGLIAATGMLQLLQIVTCRIPIVGGTYGRILGTDPVPYFGFVSPKPCEKTTS